MKILFCTLWLALIVFAATASAAEPGHELEAEVAAKLIALRHRIAEDPISIAVMVEGRLREGAFEQDHVRRVTAIHPVLVDGRMVRRVCHYDFGWNDDYGWFLAEKRDGRAGEEVWIWSETKGDLVVK